MQPSGQVQIRNETRERRTREDKSDSRRGTSFHAHFDDNLSTEFAGTGHISEAEKPGQRVLDARIEDLGVNQPDIIVSMSNLAMLYNSQPGGGAS